MKCHEGDTLPGSASTGITAIIRKHYHWIIAVIALMQYTITGGIGNNATSLFVVDVTQDLEINRSTFSMAFSLKSMSTFAVSLIFGLIYKRFGYRTLAFTGLFVSGIGYWCLGSVTGTVSLFICCISMGLFTCFTGTACLAQLVGNWFHRHRGAILGLVTAATGLGGSLFSIILSSAIQNVGWRGAYRICGILLFIMAIAVLLIVRTKPEDLGLLPYGDAEDAHKKQKKHNARIMDAWRGLPMDVLKHRPAFYLAIAATILSCTCAYCCSTTIVPHFRDRGMSAETAAYFQSIMLLALAPIKIIYGAISDRIGPKKVMIFSMVCCSVAAWLLSTVRSEGAAWIAVLILSLAMPVVSVLVPLVSTELFGTRSSDVSVSLLLAMVTFGSMIASPFMNVLYEQTGSYQIPYMIVSATAVVTLALYILIYILAKRDRKTWETNSEQLFKTIHSVAKNNSRKKTQRNKPIDNTWTEEQNA